MAENLSHLHHGIRNKIKRKLCTSCNKLFQPRHFLNHKAQFLINGMWTCNRSKNDSFDVSGTEDMEEGTSNSYENSDDEQNCAKKLRKLIQIKITEKIDKSDRIMEDLELDEFSESELTNEEETTFDAIFSEEESSHISDKDLTTNSSYAANLALWLCLFLCLWQMRHNLPDCVLAELLSFFKIFFGVIQTLCCHPTISGIASVLPGSLYLLWKRLCVNTKSFEKFVVCRKCFCLYRYPECIQTVEGRQISNHCTNVQFPNHPQKARRKKCGELLLKTVKFPSGKIVLYPYKVYSYKPLQQTLQRFVLRRDFEDLCNHWKNRTYVEGHLPDVYSGKVWRKINNSYDNVLEDDCFGLMINLDWFQPFEHVNYSVGVLYAVVVNLPKEERFKLKNVILIGIIPDMGKEPPTNTFLSPLVDELQCAWNDGFLLMSVKENTEKRFKVCLICIGCDIPASRKLCGFLGHNARLGCSKCKKEFPGGVGKKDFSGFEREQWERRNHQSHVSDVGKVEKALYATEKSELESKFGVRYSVLCELEYVDIVEMSIIDPMHNMYIGTAKHIMKIWLEKGILTSADLYEIQQRVDRIHVSSRLGGIPRKIASSFGGFTAEQWMNWTNIFSVVALYGILEQKFLDNWILFVSASRILCSRYLTLADIHLFDSLILSFCKGFELLYGKAAVTPNMHLHCHLQECLQNYGPVYSFWLFSFERYNGHLGSLPNNSRLVEVEMMRRFLRDQTISCAEYPPMFQTQFSNIFQQLIPGTHCSSNVLFSNSVLYRKISDPRTAIEDCLWEEIDGYNLKSCKNVALDEQEVSLLKKTYAYMYQGVSFARNEVKFPYSAIRCKAVAIGTEVFGSEKSRYTRSSLIQACWSDPEGKILQTGTTLSPGLIQYFIVHSLDFGTSVKKHIFAVIKWLAPMQNLALRDTFGKTSQVWMKDLFCGKGPSMYMPIQRVYSKVVCVNASVRSKEVLVVTPENRLFFS